MYIRYTYIYIYIYVRPARAAYSEGVLGPSGPRRRHGRVGARLTILRRTKEVPRKGA